MRPTPALTLAGAVVLALTALTAGVLHPGWVRSLDWQVHLWVEAHLRDELVQVIFTVAAWPGQRGVVLVPLLAVALLAARRRRSARPLLVTVGMLAGVAFSVWLFKVGVGRVAPGAGRDAVHAGGLSYPSGHAVNALVCWALVLEFVASLGHRVARVLSVRRRRTITALLALATGTGMTALDYHWLSDTIAGWLIGVLILGGVLTIDPVGPGRTSANLRPSVPQSPGRPAPSG